MSEAEKVEHPSWCDRSLCTAPEFRPTSEQCKNGARMGEHRSARRVLPGVGPGYELNVWLSQAVAPWGTGTFLRMAMGDGELWWSTEMGVEGFALYELLGSAVGGLVKEFPGLYAERFPWLADTTSSGDAPAVAHDAPVMFEVEQSGADSHGWDPDDPHGDVEQYERSAGADEKVDEESDRYQLAVNDSALVHGTLGEVRAAVAELITSSLADDPDGVAGDAQMVNMAFTGGAVQAALDERGEWYTLFGVHGKHPALRIKVTREA